MYVRSHETLVVQVKHVIFVSKAVSKATVEAASSKTVAIRLRALSHTHTHSHALSLTHSLSHALSLSLSLCGGRVVEDCCYKTAGIAARVGVH
jgi:hypothetical protein